MGGELVFDGVRVEGDAREWVWVGGAAWGSVILVGNRWVFFRIDGNEWGMSRMDGKGREYMGMHDKRSG